MSTILDKITEQIREDLVIVREHVAEQELLARIAERGPCRDFAAALRKRVGAPPRVIAELKRASPSRGLIRPDFDAPALAREFAEQGAAALSVLTEVRFFQGSPLFLQMARKEVDIPLLRKDFIIDPYQLYQARAWGADAVLLIAAALSPDRLKELHEAATDLGLAVLAEVHDAAELDVVLAAGAEIVGINSRDLKTFDVDLARTEALLDALPEKVVAVAESGIHTVADIARLSEAGADAFLIGETLMRESDPGEKLEELLSWTCV